MFGLMKNTGCHQKGQPDWYRLHYCGTCKSLGQTYGQRSRLFLNYDIVFLAEVLSLIQEIDTKQWSNSLQSNNCFDLPNEKDLPKSLQYAADVNALLVDLKIKDNQKDEIGFLWNFVKKILKKPLSRVEKRMVHWNIDRAVLVKWQEEDFQREEDLTKEKKVNDLLTWHAEPSAKITAYVFEKGALAVHQKESKKMMYDLGFAFGELIYALDAWKDFDKDKEEEAFNPLFLSNFNNIEHTKKEAIDWIWKKATAIETIIQTASLNTKVKQSLISRLQLNLNVVLSGKARACRPKTGIEKSTVPSFFRNTGKTINKVSLWFNPMKPARFTVTYLVFIFMFFHQQVFAVRSIISDPLDQNMDAMFTLIMMASIPFWFYFVGKKVNENKDKITKKRNRLLKRFEQKKKKIKRKLKKAEKRKDRKLGWWFWVLMGFATLGLLLVFIAIIELSTGDWFSGSGDCGSTFCESPDCGDSSCGDSGCDSGGGGCGDSSC